MVTVMALVRQEMDKKNRLPVALNLDADGKALIMLSALITKVIIRYLLPLGSSPGVNPFHILHMVAT